MDEKTELFYQLMSGRIDNELDAQQEQQLAQFLRDNPQAQAEYDELASVAGLTRQMYGGIADQFDEVSVWDEIAPQLDSNASVLSRGERDTVLPLRRNLWIKWASSLAAASVLIFFGFYLFNFADKPYNEQNNTCIVDSVESESSSVMVFKDTETNTTIIWMFSSAQPSSAEGGTAS